MKIGQFRLLAVNAVFRPLMSITFICLLAPPGLAVGDVAQAAISQDARADTKTQTTGELQEIVVSAQKRTEDVNKVPISIAVFNEAMLEQRGIQDISDIANASPGVDYQVQGPFNFLAIRGIFSGGGYATTGTYIDDVPIQVRNSTTMAAAGNFQPKVFDLDRVEVLRGPQGTLFGAGAEGGAIRFITPDPSLTQDSGYSRASIGITDGGGPSYEAGAAVGGPIVSDLIGFRVSAWHERTGGYIDHDSAIPGGYQYNSSNWSDSDVVRGALLFAPTEYLKISPSIYYQHGYSHDIPSFEPAGSSLAGDVFTSYFSALSPQYSNVGAGRFVNPFAEQQPSSDQLSLPALKVTLGLGAVDLTSSTSYLSRRVSAHSDFTILTPAIFGMPWQTTLAAEDHAEVDSNQNIFSQELRAQNADVNQSLQWTLGIFYTDSRLKNYGIERSPYLPTLTQTYLGLPIQDALGSTLLPGGVSYIGTERGTDTQMAGFGQVTYQLFKHLSLTAGARIAHETNKYSIGQTGPYNGGVTNFRAGEQSQRVVDPKFGVNVQLDDNHLLYVSAAKGDRIGGINSPLLAFGQCAVALKALSLDRAPDSYQGDSLWSYEIGSKSRLFDGRMQVEASAFHIKWSDVQQSILIQQCGSGFVSNLGKAVSNGADLSADVLIGHSVKLGLSVGYTNAKDVTTVASGGTQFVTNGDQVNPYSAPWIVVPSGEYKFTFAQGYNGYLRLDDEFHSRNPGPFAANQSYNASYTPGFIPNPSTNVLNIHVGASWAGWDVSVYAKNVLNDHPLLYNEQLQQQQAYGAAWTLQPLTIGITGAFRW